MEAVLILAVIVVIDMAAFWFGKDSRDGNDWVNHRPV